MYFFGLLPGDLVGHIQPSRENNLLTSSVNPSHLPYEKEGFPNQ